MRIVVIAALVVTCIGSNDEPRHAKGRVDENAVADQSPNATDVHNGPVFGIDPFTKTAPPGFKCRPTTRDKDPWDSYSVKWGSHAFDYRLCKRETSELYYNLMFLDDPRTPEENGRLAMMGITFRFSGSDQGRVAALAKELASKYGPWQQAEQDAPILNAIRRECMGADCTSMGLSFQGGPLLPKLIYINITLLDGAEKAAIAADSSAVRNLVK